MTAAQISKNIDQMIKEQLEAVTTILVDGADRMLSDAESRVPVDTGRTKAALKADIKRTSYSVEISINAGKADDVAFFQEVGTVSNTPQPFMRPAFDKSVDDIMKSAVDAARAITKKYNDLDR